MPIFTVRADFFPTLNVSDTDEVSAAEQYATSTEYSGQLTVESDSYFVTFEVERPGGKLVISEIDREQK